MSTVKYTATLLNNFITAFPAFIVNGHSSDFVLFVHVIKAGHDIFYEHFQTYFVSFGAFGEVVQCLGEAVEDEAFVQQVDVISQFVCQYSHWNFPIHVDQRRLNGLKQLQEEWMVLGGLYIIDFLNPVNDETLSGCKILLLKRFEHT